MKRRFLNILVSLAACLLFAPAAAADDAIAKPKPEDLFVLRSGQFAVVLDGQSGGLAELRWQDKRITEPLGTVPALDWKQDEVWVVAQRLAKLKLVGLKPLGPRAALATAVAGDWQIEIRYELDAIWPMLTQSARLTWKGTSPTKLKGFWLGTPPLAVSKDGYYFAPGVYPPHRYTADKFRTNAEQAFSPSLAPLIAQLSPTKSMLWISDESTPASDRTTVTVRELPAAVRVAQGFEAMARMNPGVAQEIGSAYLWLIEGDGEAALRRIHDWMRRRGIVPPADRPDWFRDAAIYGFHPGGTFTSYCTDLGGFRPAMKLLEHIAGLGVNTVWIQPIQDVSSYSPRDYYGIQEGLGTAEEYRALVDRAHQLRLRVLQDCVPHGGRSDYPRAKQHPEWLAYKEDGSTLVYWCFDFNWPTWRDYMAGVVRHYVRDFGVDGYRVDAIEGSLIPNWNPRIPYARASFARLQGGLNMLRAMRATAKQEKPDAGMLGETERSIYATIGDAVYDFRLNYDVFHDACRMPADEFVTRLRRYLHEQHYAQMPDLLRMRYCQSHSTGSAELWYGIKPMRAIVALTAWIDGMPMVYHEMESGHADVFRWIFAIRREIPELRRGDADYQCVEAPPGVFACLRSDGRWASVVLVNFDSKPVAGEIRMRLDCLPKDLRLKPAVTAIFPSGKIAMSTTAVGEGSLRVPINLEPFDFGVCVVRSPNVPWPNVESLSSPRVAAIPPPAASGPATTSTPPGILKLSGPTGVAVQPSGGTARKRSWEAWIDADSGLLKRLTVDGCEELGPAELYLPETCRAAAQRASCRHDGIAVIVQRTFGSARLDLRYEPTGSGLRVRSRWSGKMMPRQAALYLPVVQAARWWAMPAEGRVEDRYEVRHLASSGILSSFCWRPQGTNTVWDSLLQPLEPGSAFALGASARGEVALGFRGGVIPARVRWLDRIGNRHELAALIAWSDAEAPVDSMAPALDMEIRLDARENATPLAAHPLRPAPGGWIYENEHYLLRLSRSGMIAQLSTKGPQPRRIVDQSELYTDHGFAKEEAVKFTDFGLDPGSVRFLTATELEAASRIWRDANGALRIRFEGRLRGDNRDLLYPPVEYFTDYTLDQSPSFRVSLGVHPLGAPAARYAFLGWKAHVPELRKVSYSRDGVLTAAAGSNDSGSPLLRFGRDACPDRIDLFDGRLPLAQLTELRSGGLPIPSTYSRGKDFLLTFYDGPPATGISSQWSWATMVWTPGAARPTTTGRLPTIAPVETSIVKDPGFEEGMATLPVSLQTGEPLPGASLGRAWSIPVGGRLVHTPVHSGQAAAEVYNTTGQYLLWQQRLPAARFVPGSRWRLSAWVKGEGITAGDGNWKKGLLSIGLTTDKWAGFSTKFQGTFDWRPVSVEVRIPSGLRDVRIETGLNGATGKMWIDDVDLKPLPESTAAK
jgi:hypothetical protein